MEKRYANYGEIGKAFRESADNTSGPTVEDVQAILETSSNEPILGKSVTDTIANINWGKAPQEINDATRRELSIQHGNVQDEVFTMEPEDKEAFIELGSAAFWTARLSGASWLESIDASRWAQEQAYGVSVPHKDIIEGYIKQHGIKDNQTSN